MAHTTTLDNPQLADALANVYARSLFELAVEASSLDEVTDELTQIVELLYSNPQLKAVFDLPSISTDRRAKTIENIFRGRVSDLTYQFLGVVNEKDRLNHLAPIAVAFGQMVKDHQGEVDVAVTTARELTAVQQETIRQRLSAALDRQAILHTRVDENIIGGLTIRVGDKQIDGSIATQLKRMKHELIEAGREAARQGLGPGAEGEA